MTQVIEAIFENGVLKPLGPLELAEQAHVQLTIAPLPGTGKRNGEPPAPDATRDDPLQGLRVATGVADLAENFDQYRFASQQP